MKLISTFLLLLSILTFVSCGDDEEAVAGNIQAMCTFSAGEGTETRIVYKASQAMIDEIETSVCGDLGGDFSTSVETSCATDQACKQNIDGVEQCTCYSGELWDSTDNEDCEGTIASSCAL